MTTLFLVTHTVTTSGKTTRRARCEGSPSVYTVKRTVSDSAHMLVPEDARRMPKCARERLKMSSAVEPPPRGLRAFLRKDYDPDKLA
jgi:hypothetical protein